MFQTVLLFSMLCVLCSSKFGPRVYPHMNVSRSTVPGIAEYRSALTLDWLAAEDVRQREMALSFETETVVSAPALASDCMNYVKPASGKVARLMLELLKNLEGDDGTLIPELVQSLVRSKLLVETSLLEAEPNLESLLQTPGVMMGEPHTTFPRVLAMSWMAASDPMIVNKNGWCPVTRVAKYLTMNKPVQIARHMRSLDPVIARVRFIMEDFIQQVTPNMYDKKYEIEKKKSSKKVSNFRRMKYPYVKQEHHHRQHPGHEEQLQLLEQERHAGLQFKMSPSTLPATLTTLDPRGVLRYLTGGSTLPASNLSIIVLTFLLLPF